MNTLIKSEKSFLPRLYENARELQSLAALVAAGVAVGVLVGKLPLSLTAMAFSGIMALLLSCFRPAIALTLFFCGIVILTDSAPSLGAGFFAIPDFDIIKGLPSVLLTFLLLMVCCVIVRTYFFERRFLPISLKTFSTYMAILFLSLLFALYRGADMDLIRVDFMSMLFPVVCYCLCLSILNSRERIVRLLIVLLVLASLKAAILSAAFLAGYGWPYATYRVVTTDSADLLVFITLGLISVYLLLRRDIRGFKAFLVGAACLPMLFAVIFSYRRAQWVGTFFSLGLLFLGASKAVRQRLMIFLLITAFAGGALALLSGLSEEKLTRLATRLTSITDKNQHSNSYHLKESGQVLLDLSKSPVLGLGLGSRHTPLNIYENDVVPTNVVHNTVLYIWMKTGLPGLFFFLWAAICYTKSVLHNRKQIMQDDPLGLILPLAASSGLWLAMFLTGPAPWYIHQTCLIALFAAMTISLVRLAREEVSMQTEESI